VTLIAAAWNLIATRSNILETEINTAARVATAAFDSNLAGVKRPAHCAAFVRSHPCNPAYRDLE
jgi:malate dehydrogenase (oxaloacetate-decarboxylating)(NADP+)